MLDLILDPWIPVRRKQGGEERVAPWQVTAGLDDDPILALASPRADFDGALVQLLIGLLQATMAPETPRDWRRRFDQPPSPDELREALAPLSPSFQLVGDGPRFLQDLTLTAEESVEQSVEKLLIECGLQEGHFVKSGRIRALCPACAASALLTLQTNAPSGGRGHRTGLRGGGPLTTLLRDGRSLWHTLWLNVLERGAFESKSGNPERDRPEDSFPWLAATRTSETQGGVATTAEDVHPVQVFFGMPRRIRLQPGEAGTCDVCAAEAAATFGTYWTRHSGVNYTGSWEHPLSPHRKSKDDTILPIHGDASGVSYRNWLGWVHQDRDDDSHRPARVVVEALSGERARLLRQGEGLRLWGFGYDMDNMKARCWYEGTMPLVLVAPEAREEYETDAGSLVRAAREVAQLLGAAVKMALDLKQLPPEPPLHFWQATEAAFFDRLPRLARAAEAGEDTTELRESWLAYLVQVAKQTFTTYTQGGAFHQADPRAVAHAHNWMTKQLGSDKTRGLLHLPKKRAAA